MTTVEQKPSGEEEISPTTQPPTTLQAAAAKMASLYVGDLDPNVHEEQLADVFKDAGAVLSIRICRDIVTRRSLGYGYVNFQSVADAEKAVQQLNYTQVGDKCIRLMWQQRDPALRYSGNGNIFIKNLKGDIDTKSLHELFADFGNILSAKVITDEKGESRRYGFVHFKDDDAASKAIAKMNGEKPSGFEDPLYVANFIRRNARIAALIQNFTNVYIKHVLPNVDQKDIENFFSKFGGITSAAAKKDKQGRVFAFCNFGSHDNAVKAIEEMHNTTVDGLSAPGEQLFIQRHQSRSERLIELRAKYMQRQGMGNNLYVRNFDVSFTEENLKDLFKGFGEIQSCRVMKDTEGAPRGFGFVCFATAENANQALREMNGRMLNGKPLIVNVAQRKDQRTSMLQVQFQQRFQAMMSRMPFMAPFVTGGGSQRTMGTASMVPRSMRSHKGGGGGGGDRSSRRTQQSSSQQRGGGGQRGGSQQRHKMQQQSQEPSIGGPPPSRLGDLPSGSRVQYVDVVSRQQQPPQQQQPAAPTSPEQDPSAAAISPPLGPLSAADLNAMSPDERLEALGERLYMKIVAVTDEDIAPKITGMVLEMPHTEVLALLNGEEEKLLEKIDEARCVLATHKK